MLFMEAKEGIPILPILVIFSLPIPPKATITPSIDFRSRNIKLSPIMCYKHLLSKYQLQPWPFSTKDICNRNNLRLWYPNLFGPIGISTLRHFFLLMDASKLEISRLTIEVTFV